MQAFDSSGPRPAKGSSSSSSLGVHASATAISSSRCSPCDRAPARKDARPARPTRASAAPASSVQRVLARDAPEEAKTRSRSRLRRQRDIGERRILRQERGGLERARKPPAAALRHVESRDVLAVEDDAAAVARHSAGQLVDQRRLARAVGTNQSMQLAGVGFERDFVVRQQRAEALAEPFHYEQGRGHRAPPPALRVMKPARPVGPIRAMSTSSGPRIRLPWSVSRERAPRAPETQWRREWRPKANRRRPVSP